MAKLSQGELLTQIEQMSVLELSELVKALEDKFGVIAAPAAAVATAPAAAPAEGAEEASEQTSFNVILANSGANKIAVIKAVREINPNLGLKEAKDLVDSAPKPVSEGVTKDAANEAKAKLTAAGATAELQ
jgi:large subunit ribosomal protein L7/L12